MRLEGFGIPCSKLHSDISFTLFSFIQFILFSILYHVNVLIRFQTHAYIILFHQDYFFSSSNISSSSTLLLMFSCVSHFKINFMSLSRWYNKLHVRPYHCSLAVFQTFSSNAVSCLRSLVGLILVYLVPNSLKTLHSFYECPETLIIQVGFDRSFRRFKYLLFTISSDFTHLMVRLWLGGLSSHFTAETSTVGICPSIFFIRRFFNTFINLFCNFHAFKQIYRF